MNKKYLFYILVFTLMLINTVIQAQNTRIHDNNNIGWFSLNTSFKLTSKLSFSSEYHWRRADFVNKWQISLWRSSFNYQIHPKVQVRLGYGWIENFPYGEIPINSYGKNFNEHRIFQALFITDKVSRVELSHRIMLEQRWIGKYSNASLNKEDLTVFANRIRYMFRAQMPIFKETMADNTLYFAAYDELMIGFGKNVNQNIFDQNRLGLLLGYKFNSTIRIEGGYFNQIVELGREVENRNVFQNNKGIIFNCFANFDFSKKTSQK